jgi:uncharacterized protein YkwD
MTSTHRARYAGAAALGRLAAAGTLAVALVGGVAYAGGQLLTGRFDRAGAATPAAAQADQTTNDAVPTQAPDAYSAPPTTAPATQSSGPAQAAPAGAATPTRRRTPTTAAPAVAAGPAAEVLRLVNVERARAGCPAVSSDSRLVAAATSHSADMAANDYFSHTGRNGSTLGSRVTAAGYRWSSVGENIAKGQPTPAAVMRAWMDSSGHRANILNCGFRNLGVGLAYDGRSPVWTQDFATPQR